MAGVLLPVDPLFPDGVDARREQSLLAAQVRGVVLRPEQLDLATQQGQACSDLVVVLFDGFFAASYMRLMAAGGVPLGATMP